MREFAIKLGGTFYVGTRQTVRQRDWEQTRAENVWSPIVSMATRYPTAADARAQALNLCEGPEAPSSMRVVAIGKVSR